MKLETVIDCVFNNKKAEALCASLRALPLGAGEEARNKIIRHDPCSHWRIQIKSEDAQDTAIILAALPGILEDLEMIPAPPAREEESRTVLDFPEAAAPRPNETEAGPIPAAG